MKYTLHCNTCDTEILITYKRCACEDSTCYEATPLYTCPSCGWTSEGDSIVHLTSEEDYINYFGAIDG